MDEFFRWIPDYIAWILMPIPFIYLFMLMMIKNRKFSSKSKELYKVVLEKQELDKINLIENSTISLPDGL